MNAEQSAAPVLKRPILSNRGRSSIVKRLFPYNLKFASSNIRATSRIPIIDRAYGFVKATKAGTPYPRVQAPVDAQLLTERLKATDDVNNRKSFKDRASTRTKPLGTYVSLQMLVSESEDDEEMPLFKSVSMHKLPDKPTKMSFEMRRKLFDEGEFTICKGRKLSDEMHPELDAPQLADVSMSLFRSSLGQSIHTVESGISTKTFRDLEQYCRSKNIYLKKGYEYG